VARPEFQHRFSRGGGLSGVFVPARSASPGWGRTTSIRIKRAHRTLGEDRDAALPRVYQVNSHVKTWLHGTY